MEGQGFNTPVAAGDVGMCECEGVEMGGRFANEWEV